MFKHCFHWIFQIGFVCAQVGFVCAKHHCPLVRWVRLALMRNRVARWVGLPTGDGSIRRVRLAKTPCAVSRALRPNSPASCCSCSNIVFTMISPLASFAEVGFVCGKYHCPLDSFGRIVYQVGRWVRSHKPGRWNARLAQMPPAWRGAADL
jgi:hypothetical protein